MPNVIYWGESGQFGPFDTQEDGWPNTGQVMRYFRERLGLTAKEFGKLYGKAIRADGKPICERWILEMELENKVPVDISRRRIIARLLVIPPVLFGLASLEDIMIRPQKELSTLPQVVHESALKKNSIDIAKYEKNVRVALDLHRASNAQGLLQDINADREDLVLIAGHIKDDLLYRVRELIVSNDLVAAKIVRDKRNYTLAHEYANHSVRVAKSMEDDELVATTVYTRGCIKLQWGQFGFMRQGKFQIDRNKIEDALRDFQYILKRAALQKIALHPQLQGFIFLQLSRAHSLLKNGNYGSSSTNALMLADQAADMIGRDTIDDLYTRMIVTGTLSGLHLGGYYLTRADIFDVTGLSGKAIIELNQFNRLIERTYGLDETRNQAWSNIVLAKALIGLKEYSEAASRAKVALIACHSIHSIQNVAIILDIHSRLISSSYGASKNVEELGSLLREWY